SPGGRGKCVKSCPFLIWCKSAKRRRRSRDLSLVSSSRPRKYMLPRFAADYRTLLWVFVFTPAVVALQFARPDWVPYLSWLSCYFALACGVIAHNHNHCPTFSNKRMNQAFANWI